MYYSKIMLANKKIGIGIAAIIIVGVAVGVVLSQTPDFDAIIENKDCNAAMGLTEEQLEKAMVQQQLAMGVLLAGCLLSS